MDNVSFFVKKEDVDFINKQNNEQAFGIKSDSLFQTTSLFSATKDITALAVMSGQVMYINQKNESWENIKDGEQNNDNIKNIIFKPRNASFACGITIKYIIYRGITSNSGENVINIAYNAKDKLDTIFNAGQHAHKSNITLGNFRKEGFGIDVIIENEDDTLDMGYASKPIGEIKIENSDDDAIKRYKRNLSLNFIDPVVFFHQHNLIDALEKLDTNKTHYIEFRDGSNYALEYCNEKYSIKINQQKMSWPILQISNDNKNVEITIDIEEDGDYYILQKRISDKHYEVSEFKRDTNNNSHILTISTNSYPELSKLEIIEKNKYVFSSIYKIPSTENYAFSIKSYKLKTKLYYNDNMITYNTGLATEGSGLYVLYAHPQEVTRSSGIIKSIDSSIEYKSNTPNTYMQFIGMPIGISNDIIFCTNKKAFNRHVLLCLSKENIECINSKIKDNFNPLYNTYINIKETAEGKHIIVITGFDTETKSKEISIEEIVLNTSDNTIYQSKEYTDASFLLKDYIKGLSEKSSTVFFNKSKKEERIFELDEYKKKDEYICSEIFTPKGEIRNEETIKRLYKNIYENITVRKEKYYTPWLMIPSNSEAVLNIVLKRPSVENCIEFIIPQGIKVSIEKNARIIAENTEDKPNIEISSQYIKQLRGAQFKIRCDKYNQIRRIEVYSNKNISETDNKKKIGQLNIARNDIEPTIKVNIIEMRIIGTLNGENFENNKEACENRLSMWLNEYINVVWEKTKVCFNQHLINLELNKEKKELIVEYNKNKPEIVYNETGDIYTFNNPTTPDENDIGIDSLPEGFYEKIYESFKKEENFKKNEIYIITTPFICTNGIEVEEGFDLGNVIFLTGNPRNTQEITLAHELGHALGLLHTFSYKEDSSFEKDITEYFSNYEEGILFFFPKYKTDNIMDYKKADNTDTYNFDNRHFTYWQHLKMINTAKTNYSTNYSTNNE